jgi:oligopeptide/dipeptide ABC transporter ATP-binding protein
MYLGKIVETASCTELFENPSHPYTKALLYLCPTPNPDAGIGKVSLTGEVPSPINLPSGCRFHPRCTEAKDICAKESSKVYEITPGHEVKCHLFS